MKLCFIHLMRTGGTYFVEQIKNNISFEQLYCSWNRGYKRDWCRAEIIALAENPNGFIHNHAANWDIDLVKYCQNKGWKFITIIRDPCEQLISLWDFLNRPCELDEFIMKQLNKKMVKNINYHSWAIPVWYLDIDIMIPYQRPLSSALKGALKNNETSIIFNECQLPIKPNELSEKSKLNILNSEFYSLYKKVTNEDKNKRNSIS